ncbi:MAG: creatininase family protein [Fimbriimonadaceae bacterium]|nr:creatininase family protein [Fimbriimonadaceae bacterium]
MILGRSSWPQAAEFLKDSDSKVVLIPTGSLEQHGPHLPLLTDSLIAEAVAGRVEALRPDTVLLTPTLWLGASEHHMAFSGTVTATDSGYLAALNSVFASLNRHGAWKFLVLNGHGGNEALNELAAREASRQSWLAAAAGWYRFVPDSVWEATLTGRDRMIRHADEAETSVMLHLHPDLVAMEKAVDDGLEIEPPVPGLASGFHQRTTHGVLGRPTLATAEKGAALLEAAVQGAVAAVDALSGPLGFLQPED